MIPDPGRFARRIALFITGLNPQVVTETLWSLARAPSPFIPTEISLLTTREGRSRALLMLLPSAEAGSEGPQALVNLGHEIGVPDLAQRLPPSAIHVVADAAGVGLDDIADESANMAAADAITTVIRDFTADPAAALHVSIAGGRKTMGFLAGYALSLFGRMQDRLSHVLVPEPYQSHPQFFFPPTAPRVLFSRDNRPISTADAIVRVADIPFVRLRGAFPPRTLARAGSFAAAVAELQQHFVPPRLMIDPKRRVAEAGGVSLALSPSLLGALLWFARDRLRSDHGIDWRLADPAPLIAALAEVAGPAQAASIRDSFVNGLEHAWLTEKKTRTNKIVRDALGSAAAPYLIEALGSRPRTRYRLATPPEAIIVVGEVSQSERAGPES